MHTGIPHTGKKLTLSRLTGYKRWMYVLWSAARTLGKVNTGKQPRPSSQPPVVLPPLTHTLFYVPYSLWLGSLGSLFHDPLKTSL